MVHRQTVRVLVHDTDRYGRLVGEILLSDGRVLNQELVRAGMAWWYRQYAPKDAILAGLEAEARAARHGLWSDPHAVAPWEFRNGKQPVEVHALPSAPAEHSAGQTIQTGPRGGRFYQTNNGTKVYLKKGDPRR